MGQKRKSRKIGQNQEASVIIFDICFYVILAVMTKLFISGRETLPPTNFEIFLIFPSFPKS